MPATDPRTLPRQLTCAECGATFQQARQGRPALLCPAHRTSQVYEARKISALASSIADRLEARLIRRRRNKTR